MTAGTKLVRKEVCKNKLENGSSTYFQVRKLISISRARLLMQNRSGIRERKMGKEEKKKEEEEEADRTERWGRGKSFSLPRKLLRKRGKNVKSWIP